MAFVASLGFCSCCRPGPHGFPGFPRLLQLLLLWLLLFSWLPSVFTVVVVLAPWLSWLPSASLGFYSCCCPDPHGFPGFPRFLQLCKPATTTKAETSQGKLRVEANDTYKSREKPWKVKTRSQQQLQKPREAKESEESKPTTTTKARRSQGK